MSIFWKYLCVEDMLFLTLKPLLINHDVVVLRDEVARHPMVVFNDVVVLHDEVILHDVMVLQH